MSDHLETQVDVHKTLYGANIDIVRFHEGETAVVVEVNDDLTERRVRVLFKGGFWWATAAEIRVL